MLNYHIYNRGAQRTMFSFIAYCLMHNHYHFLLCQNEDIQISKFMQAIFNVYTKALNSKYKLSGTPFERPFRAFHVDRSEYLLHLCRYIHRNPLEAGIVIALDLWHYSNYLEFIEQREALWRRNCAIICFGIEFSG